VHGDSIAAMSGILKRKFEEVGGTSPCSCVWESDDDVSSSESADSGSNVHPSPSNHFTPSVKPNAKFINSQKSLDVKWKPRLHINCYKTLIIQTEQDAKNNKEMSFVIDLHDDTIVN
ncbi:hypothetical protein IHE44_0014464, partial [Lamprotornis superbus]